MSAAAKVRETFSLGALLSQARSLDPVVGVSAATLCMSADKRSPLASHLERRSAWSWTESMVGTLVAYGLDTSLATAVVGAVFTAPGIAAQVSVNDPAATRLLHAGAYDLPDIGRVVVKIAVTVTRQKPPEVTDWQLELLPVDYLLEHDQVELCELLEGWYETYGVRALHRNPRHLAQRWALIGSLSSASIYDMPNDAESRMRRIGSVLGMDTSLPGTAAAARSQSLQDSVDILIRVANLDVAKWAPFLELVPESADTFELSEVGVDFGEFLRGLRRALVAGVLRPELPGSGLRFLEPGERVYHRKISPQPTKYDRFDEGSPSPCMHGAESFVRNRGDKAVKGMARRYAGFSEAMLFHCSKYPECGVYMVEG